MNKIYAYFFTLIVFLSIHSSKQCFVKKILTKNLVKYYSKKLQNHYPATLLHKNPRFENIRLENETLINTINRTHNSFFYKIFSFFSRKNHEYYKIRRLKWVLRRNEKKIDLEIKKISRTILKDFFNEKV